MCVIDYLGNGFLKHKGGWGGEGFQAYHSRSLNNLKGPFLFSVPFYSLLGLFEKNLRSKWPPFSKMTPL